MAKVDNSDWPKFIRMVKFLSGPNLKTRNVDEISKWNKMVKFFMWAKTAKTNNWPK